MIRILVLFEYDLYRHALDHFDIVSGRILGRKQAEPGTRGGCDTVDVAFIPLPGRIDMDIDRLPGTHMA